MDSLGYGSSHGKGGGKDDTEKEGDGVLEQHCKDGSGRFGCGRDGSNAVRMPAQSDCSWVFISATAVES